MRLPGKRAAIITASFVAFLAVFAYFLVNDTRRVDGTSMLPTFEEGDLVVIQSTPISNIHQGDIIVYDYPCSARGFSVIHRVVQIDNLGLYTKGDNRRTNPNTDQALGIANGPITEGCLVGKVVFIVPYVELLASLPYNLNYVIAFLIFVGIVYSEFGGRPRNNPAVPTGSGVQG